MMPNQFEAAAQWNQQYEREVKHTREATASVTIAILRAGTTIARTNLQILSEPSHIERTCKYMERHIKSLLWIYGGNRILFSGPQILRQKLSDHFKSAPTGQFDSDLIGEKIYGAPIRIEAVSEHEIPEVNTESQTMGGHLDGCRIGFDLGGSDRKAAALIDGKVVFSEEIPWDPYFQKDPQYHFDGIMDSLNRAAKHLPRVDAIGGSAAGVYVDNEVRVASLFRGVATADFDQSVRHIFQRVQKVWNNVPFVVINDGEVTALAGAMSLQVSALLGVSMGTSTAAGYVTPDGHLTNWLNELAFVPVDYSDQAPVDEWSGDRGCAVQFFSQQGVARLAREVGMNLPPEMPLPEQLIEVQQHMTAGDPLAQEIYTTIGNAFGHTLAHWSSFYNLEHVLILGRVTSGSGGDLMLSQTRQCLEQHYPQLAAALQLHIPDETMKRHGQAVAAASLPALPSS